MKKRVISLALAMAMLFSFPVFGAQKPVITVDGKVFSGTVVNQDGRLVAAADEISKAIGVFAEYNSHADRLEIGSTNAAANIPLDGTPARCSFNYTEKFEVPISVPIQQKDGKYMIAVRDICQMFKCDISWDANTKTAAILTSPEIEKYLYEDQPQTVASSSQGIPGMDTDRYNRIVSEYKGVLNNIAAISSPSVLNDYIKDIGNSEIGKLAVKWKNEAANDTEERFISDLAQCMSSMVQARVAYFKMTMNNDDAETKALSEQVYNRIREGLYTVADQGGSLEEMEENMAVFVNIANNYSYVESNY